MRPTSPANPSLKHTNPQFYIGKRRYGRGPFGRSGPYRAPTSTLWGPSSFKIIGNTHYSSNIAAIKLFLCAQMPCITISLHTWCSNHGVIRFSIVKLTLLGGQESLLAPKTEVRSSSGCTAGAFLSSKNHLVRSFLAQNNWQNLLFQQHIGQRAVLMCSNALHNDLIAHMVLTSWNH